MTKLDKLYASISERLNYEKITLSDLIDLEVDLEELNRLAYLKLRDLETNKLIN